MSPSLSIYDVGIAHPCIALHSLDGFLVKAEKHHNATNLPLARLTADMWPLAFHILSVCVNIDRITLVLLGREQAPPFSTDYKGELASFPEMHARIKESLDLLAQADRETAEKNGQIDIMFNLGSTGDLMLNPHTIVNLLGTTNCLFHVHMAYAILRKEGVDLNKGDVIRPWFKEYLPPP